MRVSPRIFGGLFAAALLVAACSDDSSSDTPTCEGAEGCECRRDQSCDDGLRCLSQLCVDVDGSAGEGSASRGGATGKGGSGPGASGGEAPSSAGDAGKSGNPSGGRGSPDAVAGESGVGGASGGRGGGNGGTLNGGAPNGGSSTGGSSTGGNIDPQAGDLKALTISLYDDHACAVVSDGTIRCWGSNAFNQLGNFQTGAGIEDAKGVAVGSNFTCALHGEGQVSCWGTNQYGTLGTGDQVESRTPVSPIGVSNAVQIAAGNANACALIEDGTVRCWGSPGSGQLGDDSESVNGFIPVQVVGVDNAIQIGVGEASVCALLDDQRVKCWGINSDSQLGDGTDVERDLPVDVLGIDSAVSLSVGDRHACALLDDGRAACWGRQDEWQLGDLNYADLAEALPVTGLEGAAAIAAGTSHTCALLETGSIRCFGDNDFGELGNGTRGAMHRPWDDVLGIDNATAIAAGNDLSCAILEGGSVQCWGKNDRGQVGLDGVESSLTHRTVAGFVAAGSQPARFEPELRSGAGGIREIDGGDGISCALFDSGEMKCWGVTLGVTSEFSTRTPFAIPELSDAISVAAFHGHVCALRSDHSLRCFGRNDYGQVGNGSFDNAIQLSTGIDYTCGIADTRVVQCFGNTTDYALGWGSIGLEQGAATSIFGTRGATQVAAGYRHTCALFGDGSMQCWGRATELLGHEETTPPIQGRDPVAVTGMTQAKRAVLGLSHTCVLLADATVECWGHSLNGQLGNGTTDSARLPTPVPNLSDVIDISAGFEHTCALVQDGRIYCWGNNTNGEIGNDSEDDALEPALVSGIDDAVAVGVGSTHSCALLESGSVRCWGSNSEGQLGAETEGTLSRVPVEVQGL